MIDSRYLPVIESNFLADNEDLVTLLRAGQVTRRHVLALCANFRLAAIAALLMTGRGRLFRERLQRSSAAYAYYLRSVGRADERVSESFPLLDAIGAGDFTTATTIATASGHRWVESEEYEEDYLFYEFLMQHALLGTAEGDALALLNRWEACLAGTDDRRLGVCRALLSADSTAFAEALPLYLEERRQHYDEQGDLLAPEVRLTEPAVSVEGLAFIRIAQRKGMSLQRGYQQIPETTRSDEPIISSPDSWYRLD